MLTHAIPSILPGEPYPLSARWVNDFHRRMRAISERDAQLSGRRDDADAAAVEHGHSQEEVIRFSQPDQISAI